MYRSALLLIVIVLACAPAGNGNNNTNSNDNNDNGGDGRLTGELVYFSGRPAPTWIVPESAYADLAERTSGLTPTTAPAEFPRFGPVGYRLMNEGVAGLPDGVLVQEGVVEIRDGDSYSYFTDDKQLEEALRASAQADGVYAELGITDETTATER